MVNNDIESRVHRAPEPSAARQLHRLRLYQILRLAVPYQEQQENGNDTENTGRLERKPERNATFCLRSKW